MAKIKFGMMMTDARGKLGGQVFSRNKGGAYVRTKVTPTNPQTPDQQGARALFGSISQGWSGLTENERQAWRGAVEEWKGTDIFGDLLAPTGKELYQRLNNQAQIVGYAALVYPPVKVELPVDIASSVVLSEGGATITITGKSISAGARLALFATPPLSEGTKFVKNKLRLINSDVANVYSPGDAWTAYFDKYGNAPAGSNIYFGIKYVMPTGQSTPLQTIKGSIVA